MKDMDSLPFIVPIAGAVFLANAVWSCTLGCRVRHLQSRVEMLEDAAVESRTQAARQQLTVVPSAPPPVQTVLVPTAPPSYYPPPAFMGQPPPYRPMTTNPRI
jgi:hypothetical protein